MKRAVSMVVLGCFLTIMGCSSAPVKTGQKLNDEHETRVAGKYVNVMTPEIYIDLKDDGTYYQKFGKRSRNGHYVMDGNRIIFDAETNSELRIEGNSLLSREGVRVFIKQ